MALRTAVRRLSVLARYDAAIAAGLKPDPVQRAAAAELARLHEQVNVYASTLERYERELRDWKAVRRRHEDRRRQLEAEAAAAEARRPALVKWAAAAMQRFSPRKIREHQQALMRILLDDATSDRIALAARRVLEAAELPLPDL